ncbi:GntR family transcriptional regulator [Cryobacterium zongtaii]|uniref:GntR family transcriptional regulator n=1 Tax=Cryobacterium zongtaii TaxID=1259217 RepID=A0A2S3ZNV0_9MICO|nr:MULTISPECIES: GntR family transcriptional regulator [Cryobacterium]POH62642.1 GntR family transcriptional regulator [Cryobacterium zongtaii]POH70844.1 GntR family transcriptional regulator [Cryobacterium zongtaii]TFC50309.1 GntR family transcriptional regulator [Cryobacterium sp. TMB3-1-2]TFC60852.1 GntR family transcriptional regulator [Cryobacterium sp. TMB1-7]TFC71957.1 GntR family transcriptional regulator [Cryobacterium sp. TMB3-15]
MITIDEASPTPPFEQIRQQLADEILSGNLAPGDKLASVRQLAGDLRLAPGTVARAYSELESDGLLVSNRSGTRVRDVTPLPAEARAAAREYIAALGGLTLADAIRAVRVEWTEPMPPQRLAPAHPSA